MLTRELVRYQIENGHIVPQFVEPTDAALLALAEQLIAVFEDSLGKPRNAVLAESKEVIDAAPGIPVVKRGLEKLLLDRTEFDTAPNEELIAFREKLFTAASRMLSGEAFEDDAAYRRRVEEIARVESALPGPEGLRAKLYADLPSCQPVLAFKTLSPERLLHRYNCAQVQGLLLHCNTLTLRLADSMTAELRQLFKYLRFHQLLSTIQKESGTGTSRVGSGESRTGEGTSRTGGLSYKKEENLYRITVDGPLNLFYKTKRYGMNLANFFVAVLHQPEWELMAEIQLRHQPRYRLRLDASCGIEPISQQFLAYIPEDIQLFQTMLHNKTDAWCVTPGSHFLPLVGDFYCFPDYALVHQSGVEAAIELFHPWHQGHLIARLNTLAEHPVTTNLILGVSTELSKQPMISAALEASAYFSAFGFTFRSVPTMGALLPILESLID